MPRLLPLLLFFLLGTSCLHAQEEDADVILRPILEDLLDQADEAVDYTALEEDLRYYLHHPLNLNYLTRGDLQELHFLSPYEIEALLQYREEYGPFLYEYELQAVAGLEIRTIGRLLYFVELGREGRPQPLSATDFYATGQHQLLLRTTRYAEQLSGYDGEGSDYLGSPWSTRARYLYRLGRTVSFGFTAEKDAGEEFFQGSQPHGFDFYSAHFFLHRPKGWLKTVAVGDYQLQAGQGLVLWSGLAFSRSPGVASAARSSRGLLPYRSANENLFFRGTAATVGWKGGELTAFFSHKKTDANILEPDTVDAGIAAASVSSINYTGYHRTVGELADKDVLSETAAGVTATQQLGRLTLGGTLLGTRYGSEIEPQPEPYRYFHFQGQTAVNASGFYSVLFRNFYFFGEAAVSSPELRLAQVHGVLANLADGAEMSVVFRKYDPGYFAPFANPFGESSSAGNETGLYVGGRFRLARGWYASAYADYFRFPWLRYRVNAPSAGYEYLAQVEYEIRKKLLMYVRYREEVKSWNTQLEGSPQYALQDHHRRGLRYHIAYTVSDAWQLNTRMEASWFQAGNEEPETGLLAFQDVIWQPLEGPLTLKGRFTLFDVESYNARIYAYEHDVLYGFSIPFFQDEGMRWYLLAKWEVSRKISFWARVARTRVLDRETLGSGLNETAVPHQTQLRAQVMIRW